MEISFSSYSTTDDHIATKYGTCHDSPAVVPCAKYCSDHFISILMRAKWNFHHIWNVMEKLLVKWSPGPQRICRCWTGVLHFDYWWYPIMFCMEHGIVPCRYEWIYAAILSIYFNNIECTISTMHDILPETENILLVIVLFRAIMGTGE